MQIYDAQYSFCGLDSTLKTQWIFLRFIWNSVDLEQKREIKQVLNLIYEEISRKCVWNICKFDVKIVMAQQFRGQELSRQSEVFLKKILANHEYAIFITKTLIFLV